MSRKFRHDTPTIQSLDRGLAILEAVAAAPSRDPQGEIVASVGISSPLTRLAHARRRPRHG